MHLASMDLVQTPSAAVHGGYAMGIFSSAADGDSNRSITTKFVPPELREFSWSGMLALWESTAFETELETAAFVHHKCARILIKLLLKHSAKMMMIISV